jgi:ribose transport system substrate-binding protein
MTGNPTMTTIYATGEPALIGAIAATASQGRDKLKIFGWDLSSPAIAAIDAGTVVAVVQQAPDQEGYNAVKALDTLTSGGKIDKVIKVPVEIVTKANIDKYRAAYK